MKTNMNRGLLWNPDEGTLRRVVLPSDSKKHGKARLAKIYSLGIKPYELCLLNSIPALVIEDALPRLSAGERFGETRLLPNTELCMRNPVIYGPILFFTEGEKELFDKCLGDYYRNASFDCDCGNQWTGPLLDDECWECENPVEGKIKSRIVEEV